MITELFPVLKDGMTLVITLAKEGDDKVRFCVMPNRNVPSLTAVDTPTNIDAKLVEALTNYAAVVKPLEEALTEVQKQAEVAKAKADAMTKAHQAKAAKPKHPSPGEFQKKKEQPKPAPAPAPAAPAKPVEPAAPNVTDPALFGKPVGESSKPATAAETSSPSAQSTTAGVSCSAAVASEPKNQLSMF